MIKFGGKEVWCLCTLKQSLRTIKASIIGIKVWHNYIGTYGSCQIVFKCI